jgi:hypothetical protein
MMAEKDHYRFGLSKRGKNVNDNNTLAQDLREEIREKDARIEQLEVALTKVHGIVAEYWGPCPGSVETLLTIRDALGTKDWRPNVDFMPRLLTASETPVSTLCAVCDQIKELHPNTHPWTAKETKGDAG